MSREELDADLGYIKQYAQAMHNYVVIGHPISDVTEKHIKDALVTIRNAFVSTSNKRNQHVHESR